MHPRMSQQPLFGRFVLVDVQICPAIKDMRDHFAGGDLQSGQQCLRAVTDVFVGPRARFVRAQRQ
jgi:hypothetical protein